MLGIVQPVEKVESNYNDLGLLFTPIYVVTHFFGNEKLEGCEADINLHYMYMKICTRHRNDTYKMT